MSERAVLHQGSRIGPLKKQIKKLQSSALVKNVAILASGTAVGQVVGLMAMPVLSRLFDPGEFGIFAVVFAIATTLGFVSCLRYNLAIVLAKEEANSAAVVLLCLFLLMAFTVITAVAMFWAGDWIAFQLDAPEAGPLLMIVPLWMMLHGVTDIVMGWHTRHKRFKLQSLAHVSSQLSTAACQIFLGFTALLAPGLIIGRIIGDSVKTGLVAGLILRKDRQKIFNRDALSRVLDQAREHKNFPIYTAPRATIVTLSNNFISIVLAALFGPSVAGLYWMAYRIVWMPTTLLGQAVNRVFYQRAAEIHHQNKSIAPLLMRATGWMIATATIPALLLAFYAPPLFAFVLGDEWREAGKYASWIAVMWVTTFAGVPSNSGIFILGLQPFFLGYEIVSLIIRILALVVGAQIGDAETTIAIYCVTCMIINVFRIGYILRKANTTRPAQPCPEPS